MALLVLLISINLACRSVFVQTDMAAELIMLLLGVGRGSERDIKILLLFVYIFFS